MVEASIHQWSESRFRIFLFLMATVGITQGFLLPLISTMLEQLHLSPSLNGISAAMLYVGMLVSMLFYSKLIYRFGYRGTIIIGVLILLGAIVVFPFTNGIWWWSVLRFLIGIGDNVTILAIQLWITATVIPTEKGKRFSQFGLWYGLGFGLGPLGINLTPFGFFVPFIILTVVLLIALFAAFRLEKSSVIFSQVQNSQSKTSSYGSIYMLGFLALFPTLLYGILEVALTGNFPVYGLKIGLTQSEISFLITAYVWGSLLFQMPLGIWGDKIGRHKLLRIICLLGGLGMTLVPLLGNNVFGLFCLLGITGGLVGSLFSLSLAYLGDVLPAYMLPRGNVLASMNFSVGSIVGPYIGGALMQYVGLGSLFYFLSIALFSFVLLSFFFYQQKPYKEPKEVQAG